MQYWFSRADKVVKQKRKRDKGQLIKGKPKVIANHERRMEMGAPAKKVKNDLETYMKALIKDNLSITNVNSLYNSMQVLSTINRKYKKLCANPGLVNEI